MEKAANIIEAAPFNSKAPSCPFVPSWLRVYALLALALTLVSCMGPDMNAVANRLRQTTMDQAAQIATQKETISNRDATIRDLQNRLSGGLPPLQTLPPERLADLFTATHLEVYNQTDTSDFGDGKGVAGFRIQVRTYAADGEIIPAAGTLTLEAFELPAAPAEPRAASAHGPSPPRR